MAKQVGSVITNHKSGMCLDLRQTLETHSPNPWGSIEHQVKKHWFNLRRWLFYCFAYTNHINIGTNNRNKYDFEFNWAHLGRYFFLMKMGSLCRSIFGSCKQLISSKASHWTCVSHVKGSASACLTTVSFRDLFRLLLCELREPLSPTRFWPSTTGWTLNGEGAVIWGAWCWNLCSRKLQLAEREAQTPSLWLWNVYSGQEVIVIVISS